MAPPLSPLLAHWKFMLTHIFIFPAHLTTLQSSSVKGLSLPLPWPCCTRGASAGSTGRGRQAEAKGHKRLAQLAALCPGSSFQRPFPTQKHGETIPASFLGTLRRNWPRAECEATAPFHSLHLLFLRVLQKAKGRHSKLSKDAGMKQVVAGARRKGFLCHLGNILEKWQQTGGLQAVNEVSEKPLLLRHPTSPYCFSFWSISISNFGQARSDNAIEGCWFFSNIFTSVKHTKHKAKSESCSVGGVELLVSPLLGYQQLLDPCKKRNSHHSCQFS